MKERQLDLKQINQLKVYEFYNKCFKNMETFLIQKKKDQYSKRLFSVIVRKRLKDCTLNKEDHDYDLKFALVKNTDKRIARSLRGEFGTKGSEFHFDVDDCIVIEVLKEDYLTRIIPVKHRLKEKICKVFTLEKTSINERTRVFLLNLDLLKIFEVKDYLKYLEYSPNRCRRYLLDKAFKRKIDEKFLLCIDL